MKRQVSFTDEADAYRFTLVGEDRAAFDIRKDTLAFSSNEFYRLFFKGLDEKPEYEIVNPGDELKGQARHVYDTVAAIFKKACDSIDETWFEKSDKQAIDENDELTELAF